MADVDIGWFEFVFIILVLAAILATVFAVIGEPKRERKLLALISWGIVFFWGLIFPNLYYNIRGR